MGGVVNDAEEDDAQMSGLYAKLTMLSSQRFTASITAGKVEGNEKKVCLVSPCRLTRPPSRPLQPDSAIITLPFQRRTHRMYVQHSQGLRRNVTDFAPRNSGDV